MPLDNPSDYFTVSSVDPEKLTECSEKLLDALNPVGISYAGRLQDKFHIRYLRNYLFFDTDGLKARTIVIEKTYTSLAYLGDYINYYAQCYHEYRKVCKRIHFFSKSFTGEEFHKMIVDGNKNKAWESYQGNIVIRPLTKGIIGASLLKTYKKKENRHFPGTKTYTINLFGKSIEIDTMPYQEQDGITGSCASAALWFAFQKASELFGTAVPSPSDITISAGYDQLHSGKIFPSHSLEVTQICKAIVSNGLVAEATDNQLLLSDNRGFKGLVYAYLRMGIPILMGIQKENDGPEQGHEVTINGYRFSEKERDYEKSGIKLKLRSDMISKFYAHDDQLGPFSKFEFLEEGNFQFKTSYWKNSDDNDKALANPMHIIIPIEPSIKINFHQVIDEVKTRTTPLIRQKDIIWDIFLCESNKYKSEIRKTMIEKEKDHESAIYRLLLRSLPKYIWVAQAWLPEKGEIKLIFDMIYDAIDVHLTPFLTTIYNGDFRKTIEDNPELEKLFDTNGKEESELEKVFRETILLQRIETIYNEILSDNPEFTVSQAIEFLIDKYNEEIMNLAKQRIGTFRKQP